ncbi:MULTISPECIES: diacylglycerol kinase [unclassified Streptomyces]|uniref:diacylglycerol kinase n=1 Tax=unclassified Streptomyces TaxID=2593676 RepID=UPI002DD86677|nr:diacylglycerol kinase [Streptomyces sp. NBC_01766]WSC21383.1 diacylglycerol kinase [Streptomyces sp. NBC_01766]WSV55321.1 diacylglycerol kinase [Streptomyces sp. NBC_01014]
MSAPDPAASTEHQLLVVIDPVARRADGESVRIAKDVLCAGAHAKICLPEGPEEFARVLGRRGNRRLVVIGDDRALVRSVTLLHRERDRARGALSLVPVGPPPALELARSLGVPVGAVAAARSVLDGAVRWLDLLVDDSDAVVLGGLRLPTADPAPPGWGRTPPGSVWHACRSLVRTLVGPAPARAEPPAQRLRVEADGVLLTDLHQPVTGVSVSSRGGAGKAEVVVELPSGDLMTAEALAVTVSGADFRYRRDGVVGGPVRTRTWTVRAGAWGLTLPVG